MRGLLLVAEKQGNACGGKAVKQLGRKTISENETNRDVKHSFQI
jgi:hypothetical protein